MAENPTYDGGKPIKKDERQQQPTGPIGIVNPPVGSIGGDPPKPAGTQGSY